MVEGEVTGSTLYSFEVYICLRGRLLANQCYLCCCNAESVDHLLLFCPIAHSLWMYMLRLFGIDWVMLGSVEDLLFC